MTGLNCDGGLVVRFARNNRYLNQPVTRRDSAGSMLGQGNEFGLAGDFAKAAAKPVLFGLLDSVF